MNRISGYQQLKQYWELNKEGFDPKDSLTN